MTEHETLRGGRYEVLGVLGEGAQGRTLRALERAGGEARAERHVAIKRFDVRGARSWKDYELAERETRVLESLRHPNLPRYVEAFEEGGALYLVMELIEGESVAARRQRGAVFSQAEVIRFLGDASSVLDYLHERAAPVIHRDLKPGNVIQRPDGSFAFVDFGAVRDKLRPEGGSTVVGTFGYMAPEQFQGRALPASDVYSVGATALAMLTGREPETLPHRGLAVDVRAALPGVRGPLVAVLEKMLEPDPDRRAARIAPLLASLRAPAGQGGPGAGRVAAGAASAPGAGRGASWVEEAERWREMAMRIEDVVSRKERRRALRNARREIRRAARLSRHHGHRHGAPPWPVALLLTLLFSVGIVAVAVATGVVVPLVLLVLSRFFARDGLVRAAGAVREAGGRAITAIRREQAAFWARRGTVSGAAQPIDVGAPASRGQVRVEPGLRVDPGAPPVRVAGDAHALPRDGGDGETDDDDAIDRAAAPGARTRG